MITIERASASDVVEVVRLFEKYRAFYRCQPSPQGAEQFIAARLANGDSQVFLARDAEAGGLAVGLMQLYPLFSSTAMKRLWLLNDLFVEETHRHKGIGKKLIATAVELCRSTGARGFFLETEAKNHKAQALYEKMGLTRISNHFYGFDHL